LANWGTLGPWFKDMWDSITGWFSTAWEFIKECSATGWQFVKDLFFNYHPLGIIIENWEPIVGWFKDMWERVSVYIEPILNAMNKVKGWANDGWDYVFGDDNSGQSATQGLSPQSNNYLLSSQSQQKLNGEMTVKFENAPPSMNVANTQSNQPGFGIGYDVGYNRFSSRN
ncbi:hypothetical protein J8Z86_22305, partial [Yersinia enterocolitica]|nr:hypothetical protein [Yersinia enterocolitica]